MPGKRQPDAAGESIEGCGEFWGQGDAGKTPAGAGRAEASHSGSLCSLWRAHRSNIFPGHKQLVSDFMKYPACPGAPAPDRPPPRMPRGQHASGSTGGATSTPAACVSPMPKARAISDRQASGSTDADPRHLWQASAPTPKATAITDRQASGSTDADPRRLWQASAPRRRRRQSPTDRQAAARTQTLSTPYGKCQPHAEGERYLSATGQGGSRPMAGRRPQVFWAGFSGPGSKAGAPGEFLAAFRRSAARNLSRTSHHAMGFDLLVHSVHSVHPATGS